MGKRKLSYKGMKSARVWLMSVMTNNCMRECHGVGIEVESGLWSGNDD